MIHVSKVDVRLIRSSFQFMKEMQEGFPRIDPANLQDESLMMAEGNVRHGDVQHAARRIVLVDDAHGDGRLR